MGNVKVGRGTGIAIDLGARYDIWNERLSLGISLPNFLSYLSYNREELSQSVLLVTQI